MQLSQKCSSAQHLLSLLLLCCLRPSCHHLDRGCLEGAESTPLGVLLLLPRRFLPLFCLLDPFWRSVWQTLSFCAISTILWTHCTWRIAEMEHFNFTCTVTTVCIRDASNIQFYINSLLPWCSEVHDLHNDLHCVSLHCINTTKGELWIQKNLLLW